MKIRKGKRKRKSQTLHLALLFGNNLKNAISISLHFH